MFLQLIYLLLLLSSIESLPVEPNQIVPAPVNGENVKANRPGHLKAVPLERDGKLNKDLRKELLLGNKSDMGSKGHHHHEEEAMSSDELIAFMFKSADKNNDGKLSNDELTEKMNYNIQHHLDDAKKDSSDLFQKVDEDGNGIITWDEYKVHFMVDKNLVDSDHAKEHANHDNNLDSDSRFMLEQEKLSFSRADADNDGLDETEWLTFQHPEHSKVMLDDLAKEILSSLDTNKDGRLTVDEFAQLPPGIVEGDDSDAEYVKERRKEFNDAIDKNKDGTADMRELVAYLDPTSQGRLVQEVNEVFELADTDDDGYLTLKELQDNAESLASSSFIRPKFRLHVDL